MENTGYIEIRVLGSKGNIELHPDIYDIRDIIAVLQNVESLLFPEKKGRPLMSYEIKPGSVKHIIKTSTQAILGFNALLFQVNITQSIDFLEAPTAKAFEYFQESALKQNISFEISTSVADSSKLYISKDTSFQRTQDVWVDAELYFYGIIIDLGGKRDVNVHIDTKEYGTLKIEATKEMLSDYQSNPLYKSFGIRAIGKQNIKSGEIDKQNLKLLEIIDYNPSFREDYINKLIKKATKSWSGVNDADAWLNQIRGEI